jgi:hypothetical protein
MFPVVFFLILANHSVPLFHFNEHITYSPLIFNVMRPFTAKYAVTQSDLMLASFEKKKLVSLISQA